MSQLEGLKNKIVKKDLMLDDNILSKVLDKAK